MKIRDQYNILKVDYMSAIVFIKSGNFVVTYGDDAIILNYLFSYQIRDGKLGFPVNVLNRILNDLDKNCLNYVCFNVSDEDIKSLSNDDKYYFNLLNDSKKYEFENSMNQLLLDRIKYLISGNSDNYGKIKRFIDEL